GGSGIQVVGDRPVPEILTVLPTPRAPSEGVPRGPPVFAERQAPPPQTHAVPGVHLGGPSRTQSESGAPAPPIAAAPQDRSYLASQGRELRNRPCPVGSTVGTPPPMRTPRPETGTSSETAGAPRGSLRRRRRR